jgi:protease-4
MGLVDEIGGLNDAIKEGSLAKIKSYRTQNYPFTKKDLNDLLANFLCQDKTIFHKGGNWRRHVSIDAAA